MHKIIPMMELPSEKECIDMRQKELKHLLKERAVKAYEVKEAEFPEAEQIRELERVVLLKVIDANGWIISTIWISSVRVSAYRHTDREIRWLSTRWQDLTCLTI